MRRDSGPVDLFVALRRAGFGPAGALLVVLFLLEMLHALMTIPATSGAERPREIAFHVFLFALIGAGGAAVVWNARRRKGDAPEERLQTLTGTAQGASVRLALDDSSLAELAARLSALASAVPAEQLRQAAQAVLSAPHAWSSGSLDALPRMPEEKMTALAGRLAADAAKRYPPLDLASAAGGGSYRTEPWVYVVSFVVTSPLTIEDPKTDARAATATLLRNLVALAGDATTIDVRVSGVMRATELSERDPAMRSLRG